MSDKPIFISTNVRARKNLKNIVSGHKIQIGNRDDPVQNQDGFLVKINKKKINSNGWIVDVEGKQYKCVYPSVARKIPKTTEKNGFLYPKVNKIPCEVFLDTISKKYTILGISSEEDIVHTISNKASSISVTDDSIEVNGEFSVNGTNIMDVIKKVVRDEANK